MTWTPLSERLDKLPLVLAGPILRRTEPHAITVWVALKESRTVTLEILSPSQEVLISDSRKTIELGKNLHVIAVTAKASSNVLIYGENYLYNLRFGDGEGLNHPGILTPEGSITDITYPQYDLPSFAVVPSNLNELRILHGSCRKPHGESRDAMATLNKIIQEALEENPKKRPHQLFLTGDQIYVDDVADVLLYMLMDASQTLLGWSETLPDVENTEELNPGKRNNLATFTAGLTASFSKLNTVSNIAKSHLITLGELYSMYLFVWSDVLWPLQEDFPTFEDVYSQPSQFPKDKTLFTEEVEYIQDFRSTLKDVRRALANVPTYMIFDDHEITDDWYLNLEWCNRVLNKPLGRRFIQNALLAYAVFQGWGNTPEEFEEGKHGEALLKAAVGWSTSSGTNVQYEEEIALRVGLPNLEDITNAQPKRLLHKDGSLNWHYTLTGPGYEVLVLDTRTWREFPGTNFDFPGLLSAEGCEEQISKVVRSPDVQVTFVISAAPVIGLPFMETLQKTAKSVAEKLGSAAWGFDPEAWSLDNTAFERLLATLALRALPNKRSRVIFLSGDVHYSFSARLQYSATRPFQHSEYIDTELVAIQFTSSSLRNEVQGFGGSHSLHHTGFVPLEVVESLPTSEILGWENFGGNELEIGVLYTDDVIDKRLGWSLKGSPAKVSLLKERSCFNRLQIIKKPEWWYRVDFLLAESEEVNLPRDLPPINPISIKAPLPGQNRQQPLEQYLAMAKNHREYRGRKGQGKEVVGVNNIGEITFELVDGKQIAIQTLWWRLESCKNNQLLEPFPLTRYEASLLFDDNNYPMSQVVKEVQ
jgi:hypothetical protein